MDTVRSITGSIKKNTAEVYVDNIFKTINDNILPVFQQIEDSIKEKADLDIIKNNKQLALFSKLASINLGNYDTLKQLHKCFKNLAASEGDVKKVVELHFPKVIVNNIVRARDAALMKLLYDLNTFSTYTLDFLYYIMLDPKETLWPKIKLDRIKNGMGDYVGLYKVYSKPLDKLLIKIAKMSDEEIPSDLDKTLMELKEEQLKQHGTIPDFLFNGFIGNPIYHIRMWCVDRDYKKLEMLQNKKQLIELRLMELKLEGHNAKDPNLTKQIRYYEDKLAGIEYQIEKIEK